MGITQTQRFSSVPWSPLRLWGEPGRRMCGAAGNGSAPPAHAPRPPRSGLRAADRYVLTSSIKYKDGHRATCGVDRERGGKADRGVRAASADGIGRSELRACLSSSLPNFSAGVGTHDAEEGESPLSFSFCLRIASKSRILQKSKWLLLSTRNCHQVPREEARPCHWCGP